MKTSITPIGTSVGVDVHNRRCKVVELNRGRIKVRKPIANTREEWLEMLIQILRNLAFYTSAPLARSSVSCTSMSWTPVTGNLRSPRTTAASSLKSST